MFPNFSSEQQYFLDEQKNPPKLANQKFKICLEKNNHPSTIIPPVSLKLGTITGLAC